MQMTLHVDTITVTLHRHKIQTKSSVIIFQDDLPFFRHSSISCLYMFQISMNATTKCFQKLEKCKQDLQILSQQNNLHGCTFCSNYYT